MRAQEFTKPGSAGCILYAEDTGRYGLQQRSDTIDDPGLWACWGGGREPGETLEQCVLRELAEESGYRGPIELHPLAKNPQYVTFIGVVPHEFEPEPCSEWKDFCWVEQGNWPGPLHPGVVAALEPNSTSETLNEKINQKVIEPGFTAEKWINGRYLLKAEARTTDDPNDHLRGLIIKAYDPEAQGYVARSWGIGMVRFIAKQDKQTGEWHMESSNTQVSDNYQRQGIASAMYQWARELGNDIQPSDTRTDQGKYFWKQGAGVGREFDYQPPVAKQPEPVAKPTKSLSLKDRLLKAFNENFADSANEAFNKPYKTKSEKSEYGDIDVLARLPDGTNLSIMFNKQQDDDGKEIIQVEFYRNNSQEVTGEGDAQRVFATVLNAIQQYIKKYKPQRLSFSAAKEVEPEKNSNSRAKLYDRLVQRYARLWGYKAFRSETGDIVIYELSRLKPAVAENFADGKHPEDKGDSARHGIPKHATIAQLKKIRSSDTASPRKKQLAHWQINMRQGKNK